MAYRRLYRFQCSLSRYKITHIHIYHIVSNIHFTNLGLSFPPEYFPTELIHLTINAIQSKATTPEEKYLRHFTGINLKRLTTWYEWEQVEINQLNQMHELGIFGKPIYDLNNTIFLRPHWKYYIKRNVNRRARQ